MELGTQGQAVTARASVPRLDPYDREQSRDEQDPHLRDERLRQRQRRAEDDEARGQLGQLPPDARRVRQEDVDGEHEHEPVPHGGRDLAFLQWAAAARHWLVLVIAAQVFLPHAEGIWWQLALLPVVLVVLCAGLALTETLVAKMRILLVPRLIAVGAAVALLGIVALLLEQT